MVKIKNLWEDNRLPNGNIETIRNGRNKSSTTEFFFPITLFNQLTNRNIYL